MNRMSGPTQAHLSFTQIDSTIFHFIGIVELITRFEFLKTNLKLKFGSLKIENFEINLKFENRLVVFQMRIFILLSWFCSISLAMLRS